jgi:predicted nucleic acid-binding protein
VIVLDTNLVSEFARPHPLRQVASWARLQNSAEFCTTTITEGELFAGVAALPDGRRKNEMTRAYEVILNSLGHHIYTFDRQAAREYALVTEQRRRAGLQPDTADCQIAAIARLYGAAVATRNVADFTATGVRIINPWTDLP